MNTWIALFRGINVGGRNILPMKELVRELEALKFKDIHTYIQSGNVVFRTSRKAPKVLEKTIAKTIESSHGFQPRVILLSEEKLQRVIDMNPFPEADDQPKAVMVSFLTERAINADQVAMKKLCSATERFYLTEDVLYFYAPEGVGRSKFAASVERLLGVEATGRNWRTVQKLKALVEDF